MIMLAQDGLLKGGLPQFPITPFITTRQPEPLNTPSGVL
jgi:hypothetical protein